jgi:hypothetical protein
VVSTTSSSSCASSPRRSSTDPGSAFDQRAPATCPLGAPAAGAAAGATRRGPRGGGRAAGATQRRHAPCSGSAAGGGGAGTCIACTLRPAAAPAQPISPSVGPSSALIVHPAHATIAGPGQPRPSRASGGHSVRLAQCSGRSGAWQRPTRATGCPSPTSTTAEPGIRWTQCAFGATLSSRWAAIIVSLLSSDRALRKVNESSPARTFPDA